MAKALTTNYGVTNDVVKYLEGLLSLTATIGDTGILANEEGRKIVPGGTLVAGDLENLETLFTVSNSATSTGVTRYDVDVTNGPAVVAVVFAGAIDLKKIPEAPSSAAKTALTKLTFLN